MLLQSIVRIVFSREKLNCISNIELLENFESKFIDNICFKSVEYYQQNFGDNYKCIFRKDDLYYDDIIKYILLSYGNQFFYNFYGN